MLQISRYTEYFQVKLLRAHMHPECYLDWECECETFVSHSLITGYFRNNTNVFSNLARYSGRSGLPSSAIQLFRYTGANFQAVSGHFAYKSIRLRRSRFAYTI